MLISRDEALKFLYEKLPTPQLRKHSLASEAVMRRLARHLGKDEELWGLSGLLHDIDYDSTKDNMKEHTLTGSVMLKEIGFPEEGIRAIQAHNSDNTGITPESDFELLLSAGENITGLIIATALVYPDKKIASVKAKSIAKRMKEKSFARNVSRESIMLCEKAGLPLDKFIELCLEAMREVEAAVMP